MHQIDENENLPKCICDSCIIQLNVAYNLKKAAVQSDIKLRQYVIEYGVNVTSYTTCINTVAIVRPPGVLMAPNSSSSPSITTTSNTIVTTEKQTTSGEPSERPPFAVMPMIVKEEPADYETLSDITVESNAETIEEHCTTEITRTSLVVPIIARQKEKRTNPLMDSLMVAVNDKSLLTASSTSDVDFINSYMQTPSSASDDSPSESTPLSQAPQPSTSAAVKASPSSTTPPQSKEIRSPRNSKQSPGRKTISSPRRLDGQTEKPPRELRMLQINLKRVPNLPKDDGARASRTSLGTLEKKKYFEKSPKDKKRTSRNRSASPSEKRSRGRPSRRSPPNSPSRRYNDRNTSRRKLPVPSGSKQQKRSPGPRSGL